MIHTDGASTLFHIRLEPHSSSSGEITPIPKEIEDLLDQYSQLFQPLVDLPPSRTTDHAINIIPNATLMNVRPYRYPHFQKKEIEDQISSMLDKGFIRPNASPFSSPVLLVKKKDGP